MKVKEIQVNGISITKNEINNKIKFNNKHNNFNFGIKQILLNIYLLQFSFSDF